jgi:hypothetical protein
MARKSSAQIAQEKLKLDRIQAAMTPLVGIPAFTEFMKLISDLKDEAVGNSVGFETVASERNSLVAKGEVMCYLNIITLYEGEMAKQAEMLQFQQDQEAQEHAQ